MTVGISHETVEDDIFASTCEHPASCANTSHHHAPHRHKNSLHDTHIHSIATRLSEAETECARRGARWTTLRSEVLRLILEAGQPIGAYDLLAKMAYHGRPPAPPTVYRTLEFLLEQGFIHRLTSINAFVPCCHPRNGHEAAFLICQNCHRVDEAESTDLQKTLHALAKQGGFVPQQTTIEVAGLCSACQRRPLNDAHKNSSDSEKVIVTAKPPKARRSSKVTP